METSKVYVLTDEKNRILRCEGGYTLGSMEEPEKWIQIDEGTGDRYNLCQSHYFEGGLRTEEGAARYVLEGGIPRLRTREEQEADGLPAFAPSLEARVESLEAENAETREALEMILTGVTQ